MASIFRLKFNNLAPFGKTGFVTSWSKECHVVLGKIVRYVLSYLCGTFYLDPSASVKKIFAFSLGGLFGLSKELRELIPHIGPLAIVIPPKIFLERVGFSR